MIIEAPRWGFIFSMLDGLIPIISTFYMYIINMNRKNKIYQHFLFKQIIYADSNPF